MPDIAAQLRRVHTRRDAKGISHTGHPVPANTCRQCDQEWPCDVARCLEELDQARGDAAKLAIATWNAVVAAEQALGGTRKDLDRAKVLAAEIAGDLLEGITT